MDNQSSACLASCADVDLQFPGHDFIAARARDINPSGMFVETNSEALPPHAMVKIRVWTETRLRATCIDVLGVIAYRTGEGIGVRCVHGLEKAHEQLQAFFNDQCTEAVA